MPGKRLAQGRRLRLAGRPVSRGISLRVHAHRRHRRATRALRAGQLGDPPGRCVRRPGVHQPSERRRRVVDPQARRRRMGGFRVDELLLRHRGEGPRRVRDACALDAARNAGAMQGPRLLRQGRVGQMGRRAQSAHPELERPLAQRASDAREAASARNGRSHVPRREAQAID